MSVSIRRGTAGHQNELKTLCRASLGWGYREGSPMIAYSFPIWVLAHPLQMPVSSQGRPLSPEGAGDSPIISWAVGSQPLHSQCTVAH